MRTIVGLLCVGVLVVGCTQGASTSPGASAAASAAPSAAASAAPSPAASAAAIKIGVIEPFTGFAASLGQYTTEAIDLVTKDNKTAGGAELQFEKGDDQCTPANAVDAANKLLGSVVATIGPNCSGSMLAVGQVLADNKIPHFSPSYLPSLTAGKDTYFFRVTPSSRPLMKTLVDEMKKSGVTKVAIAHDTTGFGVGEKDEVIRALGEAGLPPPVVVLPYDPATVDFAGQISSIRNSGADAVVLSAFPDTAALLTKQARQAGMKTPFWGGAAISDSSFGEIAGSAANGIKYSTAYHAGDPSTAAFTEKYKAAYGHDPVNDSTGTAMALYALMDVWNKLGPTTSGEALRDAVRKTVLDTDAGKTGWDANGDLLVSSGVLGEWKDGKAVTTSRQTYTTQPS